jgi:FkbM family methyltransferase
MKRKGMSSGSSMIGEMKKRTEVALRAAGIEHVLRRTLRRIGYDIVRYTPMNIVGLRRNVIIEDTQINLVLDVGANVGDYGRRIRQLGYSGRIVSFEPVAHAYAQLARSAAPDACWEPWHVALGAEDGAGSMKVAADSRYSSLLPMADRYVHDAVAPVGSERVQVHRVDSLAGEIVQPGDRILLKLDVQGSELDVLKGAQATLEQVVAIEVELSTRTVYIGQALLHDVTAYLYERDFEVVSLEPISFDRGTGYLRQVDALLIRPAHASPSPAATRPHHV